MSRRTLSTGSYFAKFGFGLMFLLMVCACGDRASHPAAGPASLTAGAPIQPGPTLMTARRLNPAEHAMLAGADANGNGIRDDVDLVLNQSDRITGEQRSALAQSFKATRAAILVDLDDGVAVEQARSALFLSWQCVASKFGFDEKHPGIIQFIATVEARALDTPERRNRYDNLGCESVKVLLIDPAARSRLSTSPCGT